MARWFLTLLLSACLGSPRDLSDRDGDGFPGASWSDCVDDDPTVFPGAEELCDGLDNDCDGRLTDAEADADADGYMICEGDCDDGRADVSPGAMETCDGSTDEDCDSLIDDQDDDPTGQLPWSPDADGDGFGDASSSLYACAAPTGYVADDQDCDDLDPSSNVTSEERCGDGEDNDCDGEIDEADAIDASTWLLDDDIDGYGDPGSPTTACTAPERHVAADGEPDCDDELSAVHPGAEEKCDGIDNDCDEIVDESDSVDASRWSLDADGDGYGDELASTVSCSAPEGYVLSELGADCDDSDDSTHPGADETCDDRDDDCDGEVDEPPVIDAPLWFADLDGDADGDATASVDGYCEAPGGYVASSADCDDTDSEAYPGAPESCDTIDQDCDGETWDYGDYVTVAPSGAGYRSDRSTISAGIALAQSRGAGTILCVAPGTYDETVTLDGADGDIRVIGHQGSASTSIDALEDGVPLTIVNAGSEMEVQGFTLTHGYTADCGGGLYVQGSPVLQDLDLEDNAAITGGGLCVGGGSPRMLESQVLENQAGHGGGIFVADGSPILSHTLVAFNKANPESDGRGGGIYTQRGDLTLNTVTVLGNEAKSGAGLYQGGDSAITIDGLRVWSNTTSGGEGGAFYLDGSDGSALVAAHLDIRSNSGSRGGSIFFAEGTSVAVEISNAVLAGNQSDAYNVALELPLTSISIEYATFIGNVVATDGGAIAIYSDTAAIDLQVSYSSFFSNNAGDEGGLGYLYLTSGDYADVLDQFSYCHYDANAPEDLDLGDFGVGNFTDCTPAFMEYDPSADPTTWDLTLEDGDRCLTDYDSGEVVVGAYGGLGGASWPDDAAWP